MTDALSPPERRHFSGVVITFNNITSIARCLASLQSICDELVVLDSGSNDGTIELAIQLGARVQTQAFLGYSAQKTAAIALAKNDWIVLLDSDEALDEIAQASIRTTITSAADVAGFRLARRELIFWQYQHRFSSHNRFVRVFDRRRARISEHLVHESVQLNGKCAELAGCIVHDGDQSLEAKAAKLNRYSTLAAIEKKPKSIAALALRITAYPIWYFFRAYILRRQCLNGWAGYLNSVELAHYAFLKYAKLLERQKTQASKHS